MARRAGYYPFRRSCQLAALGTAFGIVAFVLSLEIKLSGQSWLALSVIVAICGCLGAMNLLFDRAEPWTDGFIGERKVGKELEALESEGYLVLHAIDKGRLRGDIDHVVIGPAGVFAIETKAWKGTLTRRGQRFYQGQWDRTRKVAKSVHHAVFLRRNLLSGLNVDRVEAVTAFTETEPPGVCRNLKTHWVMPSDQLVGFIRSREHRLASDQIVAIRRALTEQVSA